MPASPRNEMAPDRIKRVRLVTVIYDIGMKG